MTDIEPITITEEISRLSDTDRVFETFHKSSEWIKYNFSDLVKCRLYDTTTQTPTTGTYIYQNITQNGWFTYISWVLTIPKTSYYYISNNLILNGAWSFGTNANYAHTCIWADISVTRPRFTWLEYRKNNTNILQLEKGQTITVAYTQNLVTWMKWDLYITEINPISLIIK